MGADLLVANLWVANREPLELDWIAGRTAAANLGRDAAVAFAEQAGLEVSVDADPARGELELEGLAKAGREGATAAVDTMREHFTGFTRVLTDVVSPDGRWVCYLTGGMSWGDSPSELFDAVNDLWSVPEVLAAIGFHVGGVHVAQLPPERTEFRYAVNDALTALAQQFGAALPDEELNELTHHVADVLAEYRNREETP